MPRTHESAVPRPLLVLLFALLLANAGLSAWGNLRLYRTSGSPGFLPAGKGNVVTVGQVRPQGPAGELRVGDEILALEGHGLRGQEDVWSFFLHRPPGPYHVTVRRDGRPENLALVAPPYEWGWSVSLGLSRVAVHLLFALSGLAVFLLRPEGKSGLLLSLAFILFVPGDTLSLAPERIEPFARALMVLSDTVSLLFWPVLLHFLLVFPEPSPVVRRWPWIERVLYLPTLAIMLAALPISVLVFVDRDLMWGALRSAKWFSWLAGAFWIPSTLFGLAVLVTSYRQATVVSRRKLRVAVIGTFAGLLPLLVLLVANALFDARQMAPWAIRSLAFAATLALALVPLSFGYAIFKHQVIPLRMILRRGLRYVLVSRGVVVLEAAAVLALATFSLTGWRGRLVDAISPRADIVVALAVGGLGMLALHRINRRLRSAIDHQFFREAFDARRMLTTLSEAVREVPSAEALVDLVARRVRDALHPEAAHIYLREVADRTFRLAYPKGAHEDETATAALVARLSGVDQSVAYAGDEPGLSGIVLALAMRGKRDLMGVLALGPRMGDLPYTREDRELLLSVASQAGLSLENAGLIHQVAAQERVAHELTIAAEVQRRLFPDRAPDSPGLDLAGLCVPAGDVGGDYYDFLELEGGRIGVAVADVAGKGLPAALLMSMVQASLRSQAAVADRALPDICDAMNRLLYRSTAPNAYATFFYGVFEDGHRRLRYVNAGHNPPLVVRASLPRTEAAGEAAVAAEAGGAFAVATVTAPRATPPQRLPATGLVLGAVADSPYTEEVLGLEPGDVVVAYTDGVSEAFSPRGEEFGEERLAEVVAGARHLPAARIVERVAATVGAWRDAAPAHDDFTLVVARVL
jgi:phosphoserine phosphatase RsbU/P